MRSNTLKWIAASVVILTILSAGFLYLRAEWIRLRELNSVKLDDEAALDDLHVDLEEIDTTRWVRSLVPEKTLGGYTLVLHRWRVPMLIDMNGRVVHSWPTVRATHRIRLDRKGRLVVIGMDNLIKEYDWQGKLKWFYRLQNDKDFFHHDLIQLQNGNYLLLVRDKETRTGYIQEVDRRGKVVWEWRSLDHEKDFSTWNWDRPRKDPTHINSLSELPQNRWFAAGDDRFRPGNILVSARHLNTVFIIEKSSGDVVWQFSEKLDYQHEAAMVEEGQLGDGLILLLNNGRRNLNAYRRSFVQAIDPISKKVVWEYGSKYFFTSVAGVVQKLPGQNVLVTSSHGGRVFELTPEQEIVWEWVPSYPPLRVERVTYDHCPQLATLSVPKLTTIDSGNQRPYVDQDLYNFGLPEEVVGRTIDGVRRTVLRSHNDCQKLLIPPQARLEIEYGLDERRLRRKSLSARFQLTIQGRGQVETLLDETFESTAEVLWRNRRFSLKEYSYKWVEMCVAVETVGELKNPQRAVAWGNPRIRSMNQHPIEKQPSRRISEQEAKLRKQQLEALGYIN